jgi:VCBS repeat-containing protein
VVVDLTETNAVLTTGGTLAITDPDSPLSFVPQAAALGTYGSFTLAADGTWSYTANSAHDEFVASQVYTDSFTVASADGSTSTVTVNIIGTNDAPIATNDVYVVAEDGTLSMPVLVNDSDIDSSALTVQSFTQPTFGRVTLNPDGSFSYRADPDFYNTTPTFATVVDPSLGLPNGVFLIHPEQVANAGDYMIAPPRSLTTINITTLGRLPDGDSILRINNGDDVERVFNVVGNGDAPDFVITVPANSAGILNIGNVAANTTYRLDGFNATATVNNTALTLSTPVERFTYTVSDGQGGTATATVNITVTPTNDAPEARPDSRNLNEDVSSVAGNVLRPTSATSGERNDTDKDGDPLTITGVVAGSAPTPPTGGAGTSIAGTLGSLLLNADGSFTYVPGAGAQALNVGQTAFDTFTYSVSDGQGGTASTTLQLRVSGANDAPAIDLDGNDSSGATGSGYRGSHVSAGPVPIADADLRVADIDSPLLQRATVTLTNPQPGDVLSVGPLPAGITASLSGNVLTLSGAASPAAYAQALLAVGYDSTAVSAPAGDRLITVSVSDGNLTSNLATSTITVIDQNDAPTNTLPGPVAGLEDTRITIAGVSVADPDEPGTSNSFKLGSVELSVASGSLRLALAAGASVTAGAIDSASVTISGTQAAINSTLATLSYLGNADFNGNDGLVVTTRDGLGLSDQDSLQITVGAVNDAPAGADRTLTIDEDTAVVLARTDFGFADAPGENNALLSVTVDAATGGVLSLNGVPVTGSVTVTAVQLDAGLLRYTPATHVNGAAAASFTFQVRDDGGTANGGQDTDPTPNRITFDIRSVNDAPVSPPGFRAPQVTLSEDDAGGSGQTVAALFGFNGASFVDPDGSEPGNGTFAGVYVRAQQTQQSDGQWQFSVNGGATWSAVGVLNNSNALFLAADARLRFVPNADYFNAPGTVTDALTVRLADASVAPPASGSRTDISAIIAGGGSLPIGANDILLPAFVQPVNDAPVLAGSSAPATHVENGAAVTVNSALTLADVDNTTLSSATVSIGSGFVPGDVLALAGSFGNIATSYDAATGVLTLTSAGATATLAQWQSALRAVSFSHAGEDPGSGPRTIGVRVNDGQSANNLSNRLDSTVNVLPVNDAPTVSITQPSSPAFTEAAGLGTQGAAVAVFSGVAVSAVEAGQTIQALTFTIGGIRDGLNEELRLDGATILLNSVGRSGTTPDNRVAFTVAYGGSTDNASATITLTKSGGISAAAMQSVLEGITYRNTNLDNPTVGDRPFTITRIQDNGGTANGGVDVSFPNLLSTVRVVGVNDGPVALNDEPTSNAVAGTATAVTGNAVTGAGTGNAADTDPENAVLRITGVAAGVTEAVLGTTAITSPVSVKGVYGTLTFNADGSYSYLIDNADADTLALPVGGRATDVFSYTVTDGGGIGIGGALTDTGQITIAVAGPGTLTSSSTPINPLVYGVLGEYFGYNDNRTGQTNDPAYNPAPGSTSRWHFDDGRASSSLGGGSGATGGANLESIGDALFVINGRNVRAGGGAVTGTATRSLDGATDARWIATDFDYGFSPQVNGSLGSNPKAPSGSGAAALPSGSLRDYIGTDINTLQITGGIGNTTDAVVRTFGYIYQPGGFVDFRITADDGFTLILNGQQVAEFGANQSPTVREFIGKELQAGMNLLELVYWEQGGNARLRVEAKASGAGAGDYTNLLSLDNSALFQPGLQPVLGANQDIVETATNRVWEIRTGGTFNGTAAADSVTGSAARDVMAGGDGNDSLRAGDGADNVTGGNGNDTLLGEAGADVINGDAGNDSVSGGLGSDFLSGGAGDDIVLGGAGWDRLSGGTGTDTFVWNLGDRGVAAGRAENPVANTTAQFNGVSSNGSRAQDFISDFDARPAASGGDVLDLRDLLVGETPATLDRFLDFNVVAGATPSTQIRISSTGGFSGGTYNSAVEDQRIVLEGVDIRASLGLAANASDALIVQTLIDRAKLLVDA